MQPTRRYERKSYYTAPVIFTWTFSSFNRPLNFQLANPSKMRLHRCHLQGVSKIITKCSGSLSFPVVAICQSLRFLPLTLTLLFDFEFLILLPPFCEAGHKYEN